MIEALKNFIKKHKVLYALTRPVSILRYRINTFIRYKAVTLFPIKNNKIVFLSYYGEGYCDNPKYICDELLKRNLNLDLVWLLNDEADAPKGVRKVKYNTLKAFYEFATAKVWVVNLRCFPHPDKRKNQVYMQTWHGSYSLKLIENEAPENLSEYYVSCAKEDGRICDSIIAGDIAMSNRMKDYFWLNDKAEILEIGNPKNDPFYDETYKKEITSGIRKQFQIDDNSIVVLFMPTFRNDKSAEFLTLDYERVIEAFKERYGKNVVLLVRMHPNVYDLDFELPSNKSIINVTDYPEGFELMIAADYMISDFSGVIVNFALLNKCIFLYAPDYDEYVKSRGLNQTYLDLPVEIAKSNDSLIEIIKDFDDEKQKNRWKEFFEKYICFDDGHASEKAADWIINIKI